MERMVGHFALDCALDCTLDHFQCSALFPLEFEDNNAIELDDAKGGEVRR